MTITTTPAQSQVLETLLRSPIAKQAIEAAEHEQHEQRRDALERLARAEQDRAAAIAEASKPLPALREAHRLARQRLVDSARELYRAECAASDVESAADSKCAALRHELGDLGAAAIARLRVTLAVEARVADSLDSYRQTSIPDTHGRPIYRTECLDGGGAARRAQIADMNRELDRLEHDAAVSPAQIERRVAELRAELEGAPPMRPAAGPYTYQRNLDRKPDRVIVAEAIRRVFRR